MHSQIVQDEQREISGHETMGLIEAFLDLHLRMYGNHTLPMTAFTISLTNQHSGESFLH